MGRAKKHVPVLQVKKPQVWLLDAECGAGVEEPDLPPTQRRGRGRPPPRPGKFTLRPPPPEAEARPARPGPLRAHSRARLGRLREAPGRRMALLARSAAPGPARQRLRPRGCGSGALLDRFGVLVQALLAVAAFGTLMLKRFKEPKAERRPWRIWFYDTSKQAIGAVFIHVANVFLSDLTEEDPCSLYLMNFLLDATLGMLGVWTGVKVVSWIVERRKYTHLVFGEYGDPPQAGAWIGQCTLYLLIMVFAKTAVGLLLLIPGWRKLQEILLDYMPDPQMELVLMMLVVPFTVNAATFWVVDSLIMKKHKQKEILKFESSRRMEDSQALKEEQYQALLCPALDFDRSRGNADLLGSLPHGMNSSIKQPDFQDTLGQGFVTKLNGGESDHC
ncbi:store-operated calcium entry regulator STIMATE-like [Varanus komodoensis]|uniref:store-operated calcium entry regulator STIMATE-like n=1 Tax=Varanus komodoensis TaxID=61221 RepID=UPI001CF76D87|nr:store-operated calcium entry regulator STIMATE-like [Varanus komodoensis]